MPNSLNHFSPFLSSTCARAHTHTHMHTYSRPPLFPTFADFYGIIDLLSFSDFFNPQKLLQRWKCFPILLSWLPFNIVIYTRRVFSKRRYIWAAATLVEERRNNNWRDFDFSPLKEDVGWDMKVDKENVDKIFEPTSLGRHWKRWWLMLIWINVDKYVSPVSTLKKVMTGEY